MPLSSTAGRARARPMPMPATHRESAVDRSVCFCGTRQLALGVHCIFLLIHTQAYMGLGTGLVTICVWIAPISLAWLFSNTKFATLINKKLWVWDL